MAIADIKDLVIIAGVIVAIASLAFTAYNTRLKLRTNRARFWLDLRSAFSRHDEIHQKLRPGGEWSNNSGPKTNEDMSKTETYMGLFEHCESMLEQGLVDETTFREIYSFRLHNLVANEWVKVEKLHKRRDGWSRFVALLRRMRIKYE